MRPSCSTGNGSAQKRPGGGNSGRKKRWVGKQPLRRLLAEQQVPSLSRNSPVDLSPGHSGEEDACRNDGGVGDGSMEPGGPVGWPELASRSRRQLGRADDSRLPGRRLAALTLDSRSSVSRRSADGQRPPGTRPSTRANSGAWGRSPCPERRSPIDPEDARRE